MKIKNVTIRKERGQVVDIQTPCHTYLLGNNVISHNSIGSFVGGLEIPGGRGIFFASSSIIIGNSKARDKEGDDITGSLISAAVKKSRFSKENTKFKFRIKFEGGIDPYYGLTDLALEYSKESGTEFLLHPTGYYHSPLVQDNKKFREKEIYSKDFWLPLLKDEGFKKFLEETFSFAHNTIIDEDFEELSDL